MSALWTAPPLPCSRLLFMDETEFGRGFVGVRIDMRAHSGAFNALTRSSWCSIRKTISAESVDAMATTRTAKA